MLHISASSVVCLRPPGLDAVLVMIQPNPVARPVACKRPAQPCKAPNRPLLHHSSRSYRLADRVAGICSSSGCSSSTTSSSSSSEARQDGLVDIAAHDVSIDVPSSSCQQLPDQPNIQPLQASSSTSSTATAVSRRSLASITGAALLWGSSGLPSWALRTVGSTCTAPHLALLFRPTGPHKYIKSQQLRLCGTVSSELPQCFPPWITDPLLASALPTLRVCLLSQVELRDGSTADVYEHGMTLEIVALRGSVPQQWVLEFR
jgi:hypothetical protein